MLAKRNRITSGTDFRRIVRSGKRVSGQVLLGHGLPAAPDAPFRMGVIAARSVGGAVVRNRVRRRVRAAAWSIAAEHDGIDVVIRALPRAADADWATIEADVQRIVTALEARLAKGQIGGEPAAMSALYLLLAVPRNLGIATLKAYRSLISPLYGDVCKYHPSCSSYSLGAVQQCGLVVGSALTAWRILRCNPWSKGGVDDPPERLRSWYRITEHGFVGLAPSAALEMN